MQAHRLVSLGNDLETQGNLSFMVEEDKIRVNRMAGIRTVLVVLSAKGMVFDTESLKQKIWSSYPDASVYFWTTRGSALGAEAPPLVDLVIDFTGPKQKQSIFFAKKIRRKARIVVGRDVGFFRKKIYDLVFDERSDSPQATQEPLRREQEIQKQVLALVGIPFVRSSSTPPDLSRTIALELPPMKGI